MSEVTTLICARCGEHNSVGNYGAMTVHNGNYPVISFLQGADGIILIFRCCHCYSEYPLVKTPVFEREY